MTQTTPLTSFKGTYLSNFYTCRIEIDGMVFPSAEAAYQSYKSHSQVWKRICQNINYSPGQIKQKSKHVTLVDGWDEMKVQIMRRVLIAKFTQNKNLMLMLRRTGDLELIENNNHNDSFWGVVNGVGENQLGKLLMEIRKSL